METMAVEITGIDLVEIKKLAEAKNISDRQAFMKVLEAGICQTKKERGLLPVVCMHSDPYWTEVAKSVALDNRKMQMVPDAARKMMFG